MAPSHYPAGPRRTWINHPLSVLQLANAAGEHFSALWIFYQCDRRKQMLRMMSRNVPQKSLIILRRQWLAAGKGRHV